MAVSTTSTQAVTVERISKVMAPIRKLFVHQATLHTSPELETILREHPRIIHAATHGPMFGPWPLAAVMAEKCVEAGGGNRVPFGEFHKILFSIPYVSDQIERYYNTSSPNSFEEVVEKLKSGQYTDYMVLPEGDNCNFGNQDQVRDFRSHRYLELAIRLDAPILITVHRGTENWSLATRLDTFSMQALRLTLPMIYHRIYDHRIVNFPSVPMPIDHLRISSKLYLPRIAADELEEDPIRRRIQIREASAEVRTLMNEMLAELDREIALDAINAGRI